MRRWTTWKHISDLPKRHGDPLPHPPTLPASCVVGRTSGLSPSSSVASGNKVLHECAIEKDDNKPSEFFPSGEPAPPWTLGGRKVPTSAFQDGHVTNVFLLKKLAKTKQIIHQSNKQTNKQVNQPNNYCKQLNKQTSRQTDKDKSRQTTNRQIDQTDQSRSRSCSGGGGSSRRRR